MSDVGKVGDSLRCVINVSDYTVGKLYAILIADAENYMVTNDAKQDRWIAQRTVCFELVPATTSVTPPQQDDLFPADDLVPISDLIYGSQYIHPEAKKDTWSDGSSIDRDVFPVYGGKRYEII